MYANVSRYTASHFYLASAHKWCSLRRSVRIRGSLTFAYPYSHQHCCTSRGLIGSRCTYPKGTIHIYNYHYCYFFFLFLNIFLITIILIIIIITIIIMIMILMFLYTTRREDLESLDATLGDARNPPALLSVKLREMDEGTFMCKGANGRGKGYAAVQSIF